MQKVLDGWVDPMGWGQRILASGKAFEMRIIEAEGTWGPKEVMEIRNIWAMRIRA